MKWSIFFIFERATHMTLKPAQKLHSFKSETDVCQESYLRDHAFRGLAILPGAFYIDKLAKLAKDSLGNLPDRIFQISFEKVFIIPEKGPAVLTCELRETPEGDFIGLCRSQFGVHAKARIEFNVNNPANDFHSLHESILHLRSNTQKINGDQFYSSIKASGNEYGKAFQSISELWSSDGKAFAIVSGQENSKSLTKFLSPALLDASLQVFSRQ